METLQDLIQETRLRTVWWAICIFIVTYFLTHTSKSMWMNFPIAILLVSGVHILINEVEFRWKIRKRRGHSYLSHLEKKQFSVNDSRLSTLSPLRKWKRKIDSPVVMAAMEDFASKLVQEFVVDMWYSGITPDKEAPQLIHAILMDIFAEISMRAKDINLVDFLTSDVVDLVGDHLELFRKNQAAIGRDVMITLSSEERDERLKHHLMASKELHPALVSQESEYKFLKQIMGAVLVAVLRPREARCPVVRCIARELLTCVVMEPIMRFASPGHINELIEGIFLATNNKEGKETGDDQLSNVKGHIQKQSATTNQVNSPAPASIKSNSSCSEKSHKMSSTPNNQPEAVLDPSGTIVSDPVQDESLNLQTSGWAQVLEAASQRGTEVLQPENLENMWAKGRNYMKKAQKNAPGHPPPTNTGSGIKGGINEKDPGKEISTSKLGTSSQMSLKPHKDDQQRDQDLDAGLLCDQSKMNLSSSELVDENPDDDIGSKETASPIQVAGPIISEFYSANVGSDSDVRNVNLASDKVIRTEGYVPKLRCRVLGAYFENIDSNTFAVYLIAVTDAENKTWFVKRRYRNFERLHRHLKDIPNYTLHLPPKRIFLSSTEDALVHQRCIQLDKYLHDLLSIANVAEQHEVWDFLSMSSKSYSFGRSSSVVRTLAVNMDDAVDDIVRQLKGVSDGLKRKVVVPCSPSESSVLVANRNVPLRTNEPTDSASKQTTLDVANIFPDNEEHEKDKTLNGEATPADRCHLEKKYSLEMRSELLSLAANFPSTSGCKEDPLGVPSEWTPSNVSVPLLNLVDKIFQLNRRGWLRRHVFWISKQMLQLLMEDAIDEWLVRQINWLRRGDVVAQGIRWIQDILWPEGMFFLKLRASQMDSSQLDEGSFQTSKTNKQGSFEEQLEAAHRASDIKKMILEGAPTTLVNLIGRKRYKQCAEDVYYFLQSAVCLKQLGYGLLELALITAFPELQDIILKVHEKERTQQV